MHILVVGLDHLQTGVELREKLVFNSAQLPGAIQELSKSKSILEAVILSTCNRTELYVVCDQIHTGEYYSALFLSDFSGLDHREVSSIVSVRHANEAVRHLFRVTCGLESSIIGETQILGQVKKAFAAAMSVGSTGTVFHNLFKRAITLSKRVHSEIKISHNPVSIGYAAAHLAKQVLGSLGSKNILLVGAGEMSQLAAVNLLSAGARDISVVNRSYERSQHLASALGGKAYAWSRLDDSIQNSDIVVTSTGSPDYVITRDMLINRSSPLLIIDLAVPRDVEPSVDGLEHVHLLNIDQLSETVKINMSIRHESALLIDEMIQIEVVQFYDWLEELGVVPVIEALRKKFMSVQEEAMKRLERKLPSLTEQERRILNKQTKSIINQLLRDPILSIKEMALSDNRDENLLLVERLFSLQSKGNSGSKLLCMP